MHHTFRAACLLACLSPVAPASAQDALAMAVPITATVPEPVDVAWPGGTIQLDIDASDVTRGIYRVTQTIPLPRGLQRLTLLFPRWLPGKHGPRGALAELVDLRFTADGTAVPWRRDPVEVDAFHIDLPAGSRQLVASFAHTSPLKSGEGRITMTREMLNLQWEQMSLYPAGHYVRRIPVRPSVVLPAGWSAASALDGKVIAGNRVSWAATDYETVVDSPVLAGRYFRRWDLGNTAALNVVADEQTLLTAQPETITAMSAVVSEALAVFGRAPYDHYNFLVALTDRMGSIGLEHLRSTEIQLEPKDFIDWSGSDWDHNVLAHELVHSWNGKYRRPARLWTPDYRQPMQDDLLWVYEGQTQFWGHVIAVRSGLQRKETVLGMIASWAGAYAEMPGRAWRSVGDTTFDPVFAARKAKPWASLARGEDYYNEGALVWLEADQLIRAGTGGRKGLDDFARGFFAVKGNPQQQSTYEFADVVAALNTVYPHDWAGFLRARIDDAGRPAPLAGIEGGGYRLVWKNAPNLYDKAVMDNARSLSLWHSLGLSIDRDGDVSAVRWGGPAFDAGIVGGVKVIAVNGEAYVADGIRQAIAEARGGDRPINLLIRRGSRYETLPVKWNGGLRWPWLERAKPGESPAPLDLLLAPRRAQASAQASAK